MSSGWAFYQVDEAELTAMLGGLDAASTAAIVDHFLQRDGFRSALKRKGVAPELAARILTKILSEECGDYDRLDSEEEKQFLDAIYFSLPSSVFAKHVTVIKGVEDFDAYLALLPTQYSPNGFFTMRAEYADFLKARVGEIVDRPWIGDMAVPGGFRYLAADDEARPGYFFVGEHFVKIWLKEMQELLDAGRGEERAKGETLDGLLRCVDSWAAEAKVTRPVVDDLRKRLVRQLSPRSDDVPGDLAYLKYELVPIFEQALRKQRAVYARWE